jgi:hypothetical protein
MKRKKEILQVIAVIAGICLCGSVYIIIDHKRKDKLAAALLSELNNLLNPSTGGLASEQAFDVNYAEEISKKIKGVVLIKSDAASRYAKDIHDAWGLLNDDEDRIYSVLRSLKDKVQVSQLSKAYLADHKMNLIEKMKSKLSDPEIGQVLKIVGGLPAYRVAR